MAAGVGFEDLVTPVYGFGAGVFGVSGLGRPVEVSRGLAAGRPEAVGHPLEESG